MEDQNQKIQPSQPAQEPQLVQQPHEPVIPLTLPQTPVSPQPIAPAPVQPMSASQMGLSHNHDKRKINVKKLIIKLVVGLVVVGGVLAALVFTGVIPLGRFKTITYENGKGSTYKLSFYSKYSVENVADSLPSSENTTAPADLKQLVSKVSVNGKRPLTVWLETNESKSASYVNDDCTKNSLTKAFDTTLKLTNSSVAVCVLEDKGIKLIYIATFHDSAHSYLAFFAQDVDFEKLLSSPEAAKDGLNEAGIEVYEKDVKTILGSVQPVN